MTNQYDPTQGYGAPAGPSRLFIFIGIVLIAGGLAVPVAVVATKVSAFAEALREDDAWSGGNDLAAGVRLEIPGRIEVHAAETGTYTVYHEIRGRRKNGQSYYDRNLPPHTLTIVSADTGAALPLRGVSYSETYTLGGREGYALKKFDIAKPGTYVVTAEAEGDIDPDRRPVLLVSRSVLKGMFGGMAVIFLAIGGGILLVAGGVVMVVITAVKRSGARKRAAEGQAVPPQSPVA